MEDKWISVDVQPKGNGIYLAFCETDDGDDTRTLWFTNGIWHFDEEGCEGRALFEVSWFIAVSHWQSLPEPPKTINEDKSKDWQGRG